MLHMITAFISMNVNICVCDECCNHICVQYECITNTYMLHVMNAVHRCSMNVNICVCEMLYIVCSMNVNICVCDECCNRV